MRNTWFGRLATIAAACALVACSKGTEGPVATSIVVTPGGQLSFGAVNRTRKLAAKVLDQHGDSMPGLKVTWSSAAITVATVDTTGLVTAKGNGTTNITATSGSVHLDVACAVAQAAANITAFSGDAQIFTVGGALPAPLDVRVTDSLGSAVAGASIGFVVSLGGGGLSTATAVTNASGDATTTWTLGHTAGLQQVTASLGAFGVTFSATANAGAAANIAINGGNNQTYAAGAPVPIPPSAKLTDQYGNLAQGAQVVFSAGGGNGSVTGATQNSNASGIATVGAWTLGAAGTDTLVATLTLTGTTAKFLATAITPGAPATVTLVAGNNQTGLVGYAVNIRPAVKVTDAGGLPVNNAAVTFAVATGGGSVLSANVNTGTNGIAQSGNWTLGAGPATNTLTATVTGSGITGNPLTFTESGVNSTFDITVQNFGPAFSPAVQDAFDSAAAFWHRAVIVDAPDVTFSAPAGACITGQPALSTTADDLLILAKFDSIDGAGKILGFSGPCGFRGAPDKRPFLAIMVFDTADVAGLISSGQLNTVIRHEMGHALGIGTVWPACINQSCTITGFSCLQNPSSAGNLVDTYYSCPSARAAMDSMGGTNYTGGNKVPVENCVGITGCGGGTFNSHWRESTFFNELMTGYINSGIGVTNPPSVMTIASLEDLGYVVNYGAAETYTRTFSVQAALRALDPTQVIDLSNDIYRGPVFVPGPNGRLMRVR